MPSSRNVLGNQLGITVRAGVDGFAVNFVDEFFAIAVESGADFILGLAEVFEVGQQVNHA